MLTPDPTLPPGEPLSVDAPIAQPQGYHHGDLRRALKIAAWQMVAEGGSAALTLRGAAQRAGVSSAAPYRHFPSREALLAEVVAEGFNQLAAQAGAARDAEPDPMAAYFAVGTAYLQFARANAALYRVMFNAECDADAYPVLMAAGKRAFDVVLGAAAKLRESGQVTGHSTEAIALAGWTAIHGLAVLHADGLLQRMLPLSKAEAASTLMSVLTAGLRAPPAVL